MKARQAISPTGWWIAGLLERHKKSEITTYWNNYRIIRASHWREAFHRALAHGRSGCENPNHAFSSTLEFIGVTDLIPVYEPFEDGAEVLWQEYNPSQDASKEEPLDVFTEEEMAEIYDATTHLDEAQNV